MPRVSWTVSRWWLAYAAAGLLLVVSSGCAFYEPVDADFRKLREQGIDGVRLDFAKSPHSELGRVRAIERSWLFADCDVVGSEALTNLAGQARARGANLVSDLEFRAKWNWRNEPLCRRNFTWGLLIIPLFLPVPVSVEISGVAGVDPASAASAQ